jgi:hypothetical protein
MPIAFVRVGVMNVYRGALVGWDGCEVRLSVCPVCVPAPPVSLYRGCPPGVFLPRMF